MSVLGQEAPLRPANTVIGAPVEEPPNEDRT